MCSLRLVTSITWYQGNSQYSDRSQILPLCALESAHDNTVGCTGTIVPKTHLHVLAVAPPPIEEHILGIPLGEEQPAQSLAPLCKLSDLSLICHCYELMISAADSFVIVKHHSEL